MPNTASGADSRGVHLNPRERLYQAFIKTPLVKPESPVPRRRRLGRGVGLTLTIIASAAAALAVYAIFARPTLGFVVELIVLFAGSALVDRRGPRFVPDDLAGRVLAQLDVAPIDTDVDYVIKRLETEEAFGLTLIENVVSKFPVPGLVLILVSMVSLEAAAAIWPGYSKLGTLVNDESLAYVLFFVGLALMIPTLILAVVKQERRQRTQAARELREIVRAKTTVPDGVENSVASPLSDPIGTERSEAADPVR